MNELEFPEEAISRPDQKPGTPEERMFDEVSKQWNSSSKPDAANRGRSSSSQENSHMRSYSAQGDTAGITPEELSDGSAKDQAKVAEDQTKVSYPERDSHSRMSSVPDSGNAEDQREVTFPNGRSQMRDQSNSADSVSDEQQPGHEAERASRGPRVNNLANLDHLLDILKQEKLSTPEKDSHSRMSSVPDSGNAEDQREVGYPNGRSQMRDQSNSADSGSDEQQPGHEAERTSRGLRVNNLANLDHLLDILKQELDRLDHRPQVPSTERNPDFARPSRETQELIIKSLTPHNPHLRGGSSRP